MHPPNAGRKHQSKTKGELFDLMLKCLITQPYSNIRVFRFKTAISGIFYQCPVASVSQWSDDETWRVPQVFIGVFYITVDNANTNIVIVPVVTKLG